MQVIMHSIYVGHYSSPAITKNDVIKLNKLGFKGFVFSRGDYYALKVYSSPVPENIYKVKAVLESQGFVTEIETVNLKQSLHV